MLSIRPRLRQPEGAAGRVPAPVPGPAHGVVAAPDDEDGTRDDGGGAITGGAAPTAEKTRSTPSRTEPSLALICIRETTPLWTAAVRRGDDNWVARTPRIEVRSCPAFGGTNS